MPATPTATRRSGLRDHPSETTKHPATPEKLIQPVTDGVFFTLADPLPRGPHRLTREQVTAAQRERLLVAMTELMAALGYRGFDTTEIASRAGVSLTTFYSCFEHKDACVFAGYDRFIEVLLRKLTTLDLDDRDPAEFLGAIVKTYLQTLQSDLVVARAYQVEIDALGPPARERRRNSLQQFADFIRNRLSRTTTDGQPPADLPPAAYIAVVYAARQIASDAIDQTTEPDLTGLADDLFTFMLDAFRVPRTVEPLAPR
jgi:AcrR family transcriptional regulator